MTLHDTVATYNGKDYKYQEYVGANGLSIKNKQLIFKTPNLTIQLIAFVSTKKQRLKGDKNLNTNNANFMATDNNGNIKFFTVIDFIYLDFDPRPRGASSSSADALADLESEYKGC